MQSLIGKDPTHIEDHWNSLYRGGFIEEGMFKKLIGLTGGTFNFIGGLSAMIVSATIGYLVEDGSFETTLIFISGLTLMGALSYIFLVGHVKRIEIKEY